MLKQKGYLNAMFKAVEFPAGITHLDTGLTDVDWDALSHFWLILIASKTKVQGFAKDVYKDVWGFFFFFFYFGWENEI